MGGAAAVRQGVLQAESCMWGDKGLPVSLPCRVPTLTDDALTGEPDHLPELVEKLLRAAMSGQEELGAARQEQAQAAEQAQVELGAAEARQQELEAELEAVRQQAQVGRHRGLLIRLTCSGGHNAQAGEWFQHSSALV